MATIETKYNVGDKLFTIEKKTMKVREFEVSSIMVIMNGSISVSYKAKGDSAYDDYYEEGKCFTSEKELLNFITTKDNGVQTF